jgi:hypothetical protein
MPHAHNIHTTLFRIPTERFMVNENHGVVDGGYGKP